MIDNNTNPAPKGWDAEFLSKRLGRVCTRLGIAQPFGNNYEANVEVAGTTLAHVDRSVSSLVNQRNGLLTVLANVRNALESANEMGDGPIIDTIWYGPAETLFDYIDAHLANFSGHGQPEKIAETETSVPALVFYPAGSLGEEVAP